MIRKETQISLGILKLWSRMKTNIESVAEYHGLTLPQVFLLHTLYNDDKIIMASLAKRLHCDASNVTSLVDRLENKALIARHDVSGDRRAKQLTITEKGKEFIEDVLSKLDNETGLSSLSLKEMDTLEKIISKMNKTARTNK